MSRRIIHNVVIPVMQKMLYKNRTLSNGLHKDILMDEDLEEWLEEKLALHFGIVRPIKGEGHCLELEKVCSGAVLEDPEGFEKLLRELLLEYCREYLENDTELLDKLLAEQEEKGPPDRFREQHREWAQMWGRH